eukprot:8613591-Pyramimonas_sp.AAC.1
MGGGANPICNGAMADIYSVATHPRDPSLFATATDAAVVRVWAADKKEMARATSVGFACRCAPFSVDRPLYCQSVTRPTQRAGLGRRQGDGRSVAYSSDGSHLAVGGKCGQLRVLNALTLQPLVLFKDCVSAIDEIKYSPNNQIMAVGSHDLYIDVYDTGFRQRRGTGEHIPADRVPQREGRERSPRPLDRSESTTAS